MSRTYLSANANLFIMVVCDIIMLFQIIARNIAFPLSHEMASGRKGCRRQLS